jgi:hypothetical protein
MDAELEGDEALFILDEEEPVDSSDQDSLTEDDGSLLQQQLLNSGQTRSNDRQNDAKVLRWLSDFANDKTLKKPIETIDPVSNVGSKCNIRMKSEERICTYLTESQNFEESCLFRD